MNASGIMVFGVFVSCYVARNTQIQNVELLLLFSRDALNDSKVIKTSNVTNGFYFR